MTKKYKLHVSWGLKDSNFLSITIAIGSTEFKQNHELSDELIDNIDNHIRGMFSYPNTDTANSIMMDVTGDDLLLLGRKLEYDPEKDKRNTRTLKDAIGSLFQKTYGNHKFKQRERLELRRSCATSRPALCLYSVLASMVVGGTVKAITLMAT